MKKQNSNLHSAKTAKNDEFYTKLTDIEKEMKHHRSAFKDKVVFCNCDDPRESKFFHYFSYNFEALGLKKLITTCYKQPTDDGLSEKSVYLVYEGDKNGNRVPDAEEIGIHELEGDGDFRSDECVALLKEADIVITNPPFSLFREYISQLVEHDKKFILVGNKNAISYKEIFPLIKDNELWLGASSTGTMKFTIPNGENGETEKSVPAVWFTNMETKKRHEDMILFRKYNADDYPTYDNYDAINVNKTVDIPMDYAGVMGVPITFIHKYNPDQFEILGFVNGGNKHPVSKEFLTGINGKAKYDRIMIRNKNPIMA